MKAEIQPTKTFGELKLATLISKPSDYKMDDRGYALFIDAPGETLKPALVFGDTPEQAKAMAERLVRAANLLSYMESALKNNGTYSSGELSLLKELLEQSEQK